MKQDNSSVCCKEIDKGLKMNSTTTASIMLDNTTIKKPSVKPKRKNSEKRKEKSRDAARCRRSKETELFMDIAEQLPIPENVLSQMDKSSIMRLAISFLKLRYTLAPDMDFLKKVGTNIWDPCYMTALNGFLLVMSSDGDVIYISKNISHYLGLSQIELMGNSIFDYCHPCDHNDIKDLLNLATEETELNAVPFSVFIRMKNTLTKKGRNLTIRAASYKVIHCTGHLLTKPNFTKLDKPCIDNLSQKCFISVGEPIPHPSNIEIPMGRLTFLSRHSLDMKFTYVDERVTSVLGYDSKEMYGKSIYLYFHALDTTNIEKSFKILFSKGQCETTDYRFLAKRGGYIWVITQATLIFEGNSNKPQCVVCVHYVLSGRENKDEIISSEQVATDMPAAVLETSKEQPLLPQASTNKIFAPRTADMNTGYLTFMDGDNVLTVSKEEPDDLTHLAPQAGDTCVQLEMSEYPDLFGTTLLDDCSDDSEELLPGYDFLSQKNLLNENSCDMDDMANYLATNAKDCLLHTDPFLGNSDDPLLSSDSNKKYLLDPVVSNADYSLRAPYIPMSDVDDIFLLNSSDSLLLESQHSLENCANENKSSSISESNLGRKCYSSASVKSDLAKLLKSEFRKQNTKHNKMVSNSGLNTVSNSPVVIKKNGISTNSVMDVIVSFPKKGKFGVTSKPKICFLKGDSTNGNKIFFLERQCTRTKDALAGKQSSQFTEVSKNAQCNEKRVSSDNLRLELVDSACSTSPLHSLTSQTSSTGTFHPFPSPHEPHPKRNGTSVPVTLESPKKIRVEPTHSDPQKSVLLNLLVNGEDANHGYFITKYNTKSKCKLVPATNPALKPISNAQASPNLVKKMHTYTNRDLARKSLVGSRNAVIDLPALI